MWKKMARILLNIYLLVSSIGSIGIASVVAPSFGVGVMICVVCVIVFLIPAVALGLLTEIAEDINKVASKTDVGNSYYYGSTSSKSDNKSSNTNIFAKEQNGNYWTCGRCGVENPAKNMYCEGCGNRRP